MSLITESRLRQIIRESLLMLEAETASARTAGAAAVTTAAGEVQKRAPSYDIQKLKLFIGEILAGRKIVSKSKSNTDDVLAVNYMLDRYVRNYTDGGPDALTQFATIGTSYPDKEIRNLQKAMGLQVDGDFGRQTMVALATGGRVKLDATSLGKIKSDPKVLDKTSLRLAMGVVAGKITQEQFDAAVEGMATGVRPSTVARDSDAAPSGKMPTFDVPAGTVKTGSPQVTVRRLPMNLPSISSED
jgi:hypothetical protein